MTIRVEILSDGVRYPRRACPSAAGVDFFAPFDISIPPTGETFTIRSGVKLAIPNSLFVQLQGRSGLTQRGLWVHPGIIDPDYRGEVKVVVRNTSKETIFIPKREAFVQGLLLPRLMFSWLSGKVGSNETLRGTRGFGSTTPEVWNKGESSEAASTPKDQEELATKKVSCPNFKVFVFAALFKKSRKYECIFLQKF